MSTINKKTVGAVAIIAIIAVAAVAGFVFFGGTPAGAEPIRIGVLEPLTGGSSASGLGALRGFQVAVQQLNAEGGILGRPVVMFAEDDESSPEKGAAAATKLITVDNVDFLLGTISSSVVMQVAEVAADYETVFMTTNPTTSALTQLVVDDYARYKYIFRTAWNVSQWMFAWFDDFTTMFPGIDRLMFVSEDLAWANEGDVAMEGYCNASGIAYQGLLFAPGTTDFTPEIATIEAFDPDIVFCDLLLATSVNIQKQWYTLKPDILFIGASGVLSYPQTIYELGTADTNCSITYNHLWNVSLTPKTIDYFNDFVTLAGEQPFGADVTSYDGLMILAAAIEAAGTIDSTAVIAELETGTFVGARGNYAFLANHQAEYIPGVVIQWINSEPTVIWPESVAEGTYVRAPWLSYP